MEVGESFKSEKLQEYRFNVWKQKVDLVLALLGLDDFTFDPQAPQDPNELKNGKRMMPKSNAAIGFSLRYEHLQPVHGAKRAFDIWTEVMNLFNQR